MEQESKPRLLTKQPHYGTSGKTWLESEEIPYVSRHGRGSGRRGSVRARVVVPGGALHTVIVLPSDCPFSMPVKSKRWKGYVMRDHTGEFVLVPEREQ